MYARIAKEALCDVLGFNSGDTGTTSSPPASRVLLRRMHVDRDGLRLPRPPLLSDALTLSVGFHFSRRCY